MTDYGQPLQFGVSVTPDAANFEGIAALVDKAEALGYELAAIQDHPYNARFFDTWTLMTYLAARTKTIRFTPDVANLGLRPTPMLAKAAATLDLLSGGRLELGIGSGGFWDAIAAMGGERRTPGEAVKATEESIELMRSIWSGRRVINYEGEFHHLRGYQPGPPPAHHIGLWVGAMKPKMLNLIGRLADGWFSPLNVYVPPDQVPASQALIDEAAQSAGRQPRDIRRIYNVTGVIGGGGGQGLNGSPAVWVGTLTEWALELGFDTFIFWAPNGDSRQLELFAHEVAPAVREAVAKARG